MKNGSSTCRSCGHFGSSGCPEETAQESCGSFLSWSELWAKETAAIERAQRVTYVAAALLITLATLVILLPKSVLG